MILGLITLCVAGVLPGDFTDNGCLTYEAVGFNSIQECLVTTVEIIDSKELKKLTSKEGDLDITNVECLIDNEWSE